MDFWRKIRPYIIFAVITLGLGGGIALLTRNAMQDYMNVNQPALSPSPKVFPIVWSILYTVMALSAARIWRSRCPERGDALLLYWLQLAVNLVWPILYFTFGAYLLAFFWLILLLVLVVAMAIEFYRCVPWTGLAQIPYILWLVFAGYLNLSIYLLNRVP